MKKALMSRLALTGLLFLLLLSVFAASAPATALASDSTASAHGGAPQSGGRRDSKSPRIFNPGSKPYGKSYSEWAARWLEWTLEIPTPQNPLLDPDGTFCHVGQSGPVFFLGSNFGGESVRSCTVSAGKAVLASPGASVCLLHIDGETEEELRRCALDGLATISLATDVDGVAIDHLNKYFVLTSLVGFTLPEENVLELPAGEHQAVFAGYMLLFHPLPVGEHVIHLHDEFADGFVSDVTYNLTVTPR